MHSKLVQRRMTSSCPLRFHPHIGIGIAAFGPRAGIVAVDGMASNAVTVYVK